MTAFLSIIALWGITFVIAAPPTFPDTWQSSTVDGIAIFQGGVKKPDGSVCCPAGTPGCKVQTVTLAGTTYTDGANNRTRSDTVRGIIVNWYDPVNLQMALEPNPAGKGYICGAACPTQGEYNNPLALKPDATDKGAKEINGVSTEEWVQYDTLLKVIRMDEQDFYIDQSGSQPKPVSVIEKLTPFDVPIIHPVKELGESATNYTNFSQASLDPETFDIVNCTKDHCHCPKPKNGCNQQESFSSRIYQRAGVMEPTTIEQQIHDKPKREQHESRSVTKTAGGTWANDWSATEAAIMLINQGGVAEPDGDFCCEPQATVQCQIQLQNGGGVRYMDHTNQRTRIEGTDGTIQVDDYKALKSMEVIHNGTHDVCKKYCPIDKDDKLDGGAAYFLDDDAKDMGATTFDGKPAEEWQWKDKIFKIITMSTTNFWAATSTTGEYTPMAQAQDLSPFGRHLGQSNMTWTDFKAGKQPAEKFDIQGMSSCPMDNGCNAPPAQLRRLQARQYHTFAKYQVHLP